MLTPQPGLWELKPGVHSDGLLLRCLFLTSHCLSLNAHGLSSSTFPLPLLDLSTALRLGHLPVLRGEAGAARPGAWSDIPIWDSSCCFHPLSSVPCLRPGPRRSPLAMMMLASWERLQWRWSATDRAPNSVLPPPPPPPPLLSCSCRSGFGSLALLLIKSCWRSPVLQVGNSVSGHLCISQPWPGMFRGALRLRAVGRLVRNQRDDSKVTWTVLIISLEEPADGRRGAPRPHAIHRGGSGNRAVGATCAQPKRRQKGAVDRVDHLFCPATGLWGDGAGNRDAVRRPHVAIADCDSCAHSRASPLVLRHLSSSCG